jgi:zinc protease
VRAAVLVSLFALLSPAAALAGPPRKLTTVEGITEYRLDNGLRVLLFRDPSAATVTVDITVLVGSRHEGYGETGMAHLLEHMQFKGTPTFPDIPKLLKQRGADFNANTWLDRTTYFETLPAGKDNLEFALSLEADRLVHSFIRGEDLKSEMTVVRNEFEMGENNPEYILSQRLVAAAHEWHNYAKSTIGNRSDIERVPIPRLQAFYHKYYRPDNALLVIGGAFDKRQALADVAKYFGALERPQQPLEQTYTEEPPQDGEHHVTLRRVGAVGAVGVVYHIPAAADPDFPAVYILNRVLVSEPSGRLYKGLVQQKLATRVSGTAYPLHDPGYIEVTAQVDRKNRLEDVQNRLIELLEDPANHHFTAAEVDRARAEFRKERQLLMTDSQAVAMELGEWEAKGDWRLFFLERDRVLRVKPDDVDRAAVRYLIRSNRTAGMFVPTKKPGRAVVPPAPDVLAMIKDYRGQTAVAAGEAFEPTPPNIEKRVKRQTLHVGLKTALLAKKTRGGVVTAELTLHYGNRESLHGHNTATEFLGTLMLRGTRKHTRQQLKDELSRLGAEWSASGGLGEVSFTVMTTRKNFPAVLRLLAEVLSEPSFPAHEFDVLKRQQRDQLERASTEPQALAFRAFRRHVNPYSKDDIQYVPTTEEALARLEAVTLDEVQKLYTEQLGAQNGELAVVGDFDPDATLKQVRELLGDWKASVQYRRIPNPAKTDVPGTQQVIETPDKENAVYMSGELLALTDADPDYAALTVGNFLFGGGPLSSRLANRVRQKEGLSYGVGSMFSAAAKDPRGQLIMFAICNPRNINKLDQAVREEFARLLKDGVRKPEVEEAKRSYLEQLKLQWANDGSLASALAEELDNGRTFSHYVALEQKMRSLTPAEVTAAVRKHFDPKRLITVRAGDFPRKSAAQ